MTYKPVICEVKYLAHDGKNTLKYILKGMFSTTKCDWVISIIIAISILAVIIVLGLYQYYAVLFFVKLIGILSWILLIYMIFLKIQKAHTTCVIRGRE